MKNLRGSLITLDKTMIERVESDNVRYTTTSYEVTKEVLSSVKCAICLKRIWMESKPETTIMREAFLVTDARAYIGGTPDYIKNSNILISVHYNECQKELSDRLNSGQYINKPE